MKTFSPARFPAFRHRRTRAKPWIRAMVAEHRLTSADLILPVFVHEKDDPESVTAMPGVERLSLDGLVATASLAAKLGIPALAVFPVIDPAAKNERGDEASNPDNLVCRAVRRIKEAGLDIGVICDVALDPFTSHGQDGLLRDGEIINDETVEVLCQQAVNQAQAGCDVIAPSDMMDGRIGAIRKALDDHHHSDVVILAYAAKYASSFYGPFRDALGSQKNLGTADKRTYQMDPANGDEAMREVASDLAEGADMVMIKPGMPYLDIVRRVKDTFGVPTAAYHVSGEYAMLKAAAQAGWLDEIPCTLEALLSFKRAGADAILTYSALDIAQYLRDHNA